MLVPTNPFSEDQHKEMLYQKIDWLTTKVEIYQIACCVLIFINLIALVYIIYDNWII